MHSRTGNAGAGGEVRGDGGQSDLSELSESDASCDSTMNEELGMCYDGLGYAKRFELRQCKRMERGI
jgi:hypothetical protein